MKRYIFRGVIDPITVIGVLFLIVTLGIGTYVASDRKFDFNILERAGKFDFIPKEDLAPSSSGGSTNNNNDSFNWDKDYTTADEEEFIEKAQGDPFNQLNTSNPPPPSEPEPETPIEPSVNLSAPQISDTSDGICMANGMDLKTGDVVTGNLGGESTNEFSRCGTKGWENCSTCTIADLTIGAQYQIPEYEKAIAEAEEKCESGGGVWLGNSCGTAESRIEEIDLSRFGEENETKLVTDFKDTSGKIVYTDTQHDIDIQNYSTVEKTDEGFDRTATTVIRNNQGNPISSISIPYTIDQYTSTAKIQGDITETLNTVIRNANTGEILNYLSQNINLNQQIQQQNLTTTIPNYQYNGYDSLEDCTEQNTGGGKKGGAASNCYGNHSIPNASLNNFAKCQDSNLSPTEQQVCNIKMSETLNAPIIGRYINAFSGGEYLQWQQLGYNSAQEAIQDCVNRNGVASGYACSRQMTGLGSEQVASSVSLGTTITAALALSYAAGAYTAGSLTGAQAISLVFKGLNVFQIGTAVDSCITNPGSEYCEYSLIMAATGTANVLTAGTKAGVLVNLLNIGTDVYDIKNSCGDGQFASNTNCALAWGGLVVDTTQGGFDIRSVVNDNLSGLSGNLGSLPDVNSNIIPDTNRFFGTPEIRLDPDDLLVNQIQQIEALPPDQFVKFARADDIASGYLAGRSQTASQTSKASGLPPIPAIVYGRYNLDPSSDGSFEELQSILQGQRADEPTRVDIPKPDVIVNYPPTIKISRPESTIPTNGINQALEAVKNQAVDALDSWNGSTFQSQPIIANDTLKNTDLSVKVPNSPDEILDIISHNPDGSLTVRDHVHGETIYLNRNQGISINNNTSIHWVGDNNFVVVIHDNPTLLTKIFGETTTSVNLQSLQKTDIVPFHPEDKIRTHTTIASYIDGVQATDEISIKKLPPNEIPIYGQVYYKYNDPETGQAITLPFEDINLLPVSTTRKSILIDFGVLDINGNFRGLSNAYLASGIKITDIGVIDSIQINALNPNNITTRIIHVFPPVWQRMSDYIPNFIKNNPIANAIFGNPTNILGDIPTPPTTRIGDWINRILKPNADYFERYGKIQPFDNITDENLRVLQNELEIRKTTVRDDVTINQDKKTEWTNFLIENTNGPVIEIGGPTLSGYKLIDIQNLKRPITVTNIDGVVKFEGIGLVGIADKKLDATHMNIKPNSVGSFISKSLPKSIYPRYFSEAYKALEPGGIIIIDSTAHNSELIPLAENTGFKFVKSYVDSDSQVGLVFQKPGFESISESIQFRTADFLDGVRTQWNNFVESDWNPLNWIVGGNSSAIDPVAIELPESKISRYFTKTPIENPRELLTQITEYQKTVLDEFGLPQPNLKQTNPNLYYEQLMEVVNKYNIQVRSFDEIPEQFKNQAPNNSFYDDSWGTDSVYLKKPNSNDPEELKKAVHEIQHALDYRFNNESYPIEWKEYRAYMAEYNLDGIRNEANEELQNSLSFIFGDRSIAGSTRYYLNQAQVTTMPWDKTIVNSNSSNSFIVTDRNGKSSWARDISQSDVTPEFNQHLNELEYSIRYYYPDENKGIIDFYGYKKGATEGPNPIPTITGKSVGKGETRNAILITDHEKGISWIMYEYDRSGWDGAELQLEPIARGIKIPIDNIEGGAYRYLPIESDLSFFPDELKKKYGILEFVSPVTNIINPFDWLGRIARNIEKAQWQNLGADTGELHNANIVFVVWDQRPKSDFTLPIVRIKPYIIGGNKIFLPGISWAKVETIEVRISEGGIINW